MDIWLSLPRGSLSPILHHFHILWKLRPLVAFTDTYNSACVALTWMANARVHVLTVAVREQQRCECERAVSRALNTRRLDVYSHAGLQLFLRHIGELVPCLF